MTVEKKWGQKGGPWEFNLRDLFRWCQLMLVDQSPGCYDPGQHVFLVYGERMRSREDKEKVSFTLALCVSIWKLISSYVREGGYSLAIPNPVKLFGNLEILIIPQHTYIKCLPTSVSQDRIVYVGVHIFLFIWISWFTNFPKTVLPSVIKN